VALLKEHVASGKITARTKWSSQYLLLVKHEDAYCAMCSNTAGSTPRELFEDEVESLVEALDKDKSVVKVRAL
jgi:pre-mRNA-processing factor 40